jgi:putative DNA primase/helicase
MLIPFVVTIPDGQRNPNLKRELLEELPGILTWAVQGCLEWQREQLCAPPVVLAATEEYQKGEDPVEEFIADCCERVSGAVERAGDLYRAFQLWRQDAGEAAMSQKAFGTLLADKGHTVSKSNGVLFRRGLRLLKRQYGLGPGRLEDRGRENEGRVGYDGSDLPP